MGVDADGTIVMVECKLEANREARRMVVGQMPEYAGQLRGRSYEEFEEMMTDGPGPSLVEIVRQHISDEQWSEVDFRAGVEHGLGSGEFRLVIAINGMNDELKGIVEYLSERRVRLETLELQRFWDENSGIEVLVPEMYGLAGRPSRPRPTEIWNWERFERDATHKGLGSDQIKAIKEFHESLPKLGAEIKWGTGTGSGWFGAKWPFSSASVVGANSYGKLLFSFGSLGKSDAEKAFRERLRELAAHKLGLPIPANYEKKYPSFDFDWREKTGLLLESLKAILSAETPSVA